MLRQLRNSAEPEERDGWLLRLLKVIFSLLVVGVLLWLAVRDVDLEAAWDALLQASAKLVLLAVFSVGINVWAKAARWGVMLGERRNKTNFRMILSALMIGQTLNWFIPGRWGDLSRATLLGGNGVGKTFSLGTVALEKIIDLAAYALLFAALLLLLPLPSWLSDSGYTMIAISAVLVVGVGFLAAFPRQIERIYSKLLALVPAGLQPRILVRIQAGLASLEILGRGTDMLKMSLLTAVIWATAIWNIDLTGRALHMNISWAAAVTVLIVLQAGISIPVIPGRFGLFQYLCILALGLFGIDDALGLTFGILLQAIVLIPPTLVSLVLFALMGLSTRATREETVPDR